MKKTLLITFLTLVAVALGAAGLLAALGAFSGSIDDPTVAPCRRPPTTVSAPRAVLDHREALVRFTCNETQLSGTLYLPLRPGPHPTVVWVHGSGEQPRLSYGPLVASFVDDGIAFFSYDKRGVADSEGSCCPDEHGHFNLVTADAVGAIEAVRSSSAVDDAQVGFVGASAAGWIAPRAAEESSHVAFIALASPGVLQHSLVARFEQEAADGTKPRRARAATPLMEAVRLRPDAVPQAPRHPRPVALRRRRPQRAAAPQRRAAPVDQAATQQGLDDHRLPRRRPRALRRAAHRPPRRAHGRGVGPRPCAHQPLSAARPLHMRGPRGQPSRCRDAAVSGVLHMTRAGLVGTLRLTGPGVPAGQLQVRLAEASSSRARGTLSGRRVTFTFRL